MKDRKRLILNLSPEMHDKLTRLAAEDLRSLNSEAAVLLRAAIELRENPPRLDTNVRGL